MSIKTKVRHTRIKMVLGWVGITFENIIRLWKIIIPYFQVSLGIIIGITLVINLILFTDINKGGHKVIVLASEVSLTQEELVSANSHQTIETPTDNISVESLINKYFGSQSAIALAIAKAESGLKHDAIGKNTNGTLDVGIFQINDIHGLSVEDRLDIEKNIKFAYELYQRDGWTPWVAYNNNSFKKHL